MIVRRALIALLLLAGLVAGSVYAVGYLPIAPLMSTAERYLPMPAAFSEAEVSGSLRAGQVEQLSVPRVGGVELGEMDMAWEVQGRALATGRLRMDVQGGLENARFQGVATRSLGGWQFSEGSGEVSVERLREMARERGHELPPGSGTVHYQIDHLAISGGELQAVEGRVTGQDLRATHEGRTLDLGSVTTTVTGSGDQVSGEVTDQGGPIGVRGDWRASRDGRYTIDEVVTLRGGADPALADWLHEVGEPTGEGFRIQESGRQ